MRSPAPPRVDRLIASVLRHPAVMRLKSWLRAAVWAAKGAGTRNPDLPQRVDSMLFVCLGNICRSPFGAELAARVLAQAGREGVTCSSAGIRPSQAAQSPVEACEAAQRYGLSLVSHRPQPLTRELVEAYDLVVVMEWWHLARLRELYPQYRDRIVLLSLFDGAARGSYERYNIADPFGQPPDAYDACYGRIERAVRALVARTHR